MEERSKDYFEGTLQLRNCSKEAVRFVREDIIRNEDRGVFIAKEDRVRGGIDLKLSSQKYMQVVGKKIQNKFGGDLKISRKLFTRNRLTSKEVYRVTVLFRMPEFKVGDTVVIKGKEIKITKLDKKIHGRDTETGKKRLFNYS